MALAALYQLLPDQPFIALCAVIATGLVLFVYCAGIGAGDLMRSATV